MHRGPSVVPTVFPPLTNTGDLVSAIARVSHEPRHVVISRLLEEHQCIGFNVRRDATAARLTPYIWSDELLEFYRTTKSFLYETSVWNRTRLKQEMRSWIGAYLVDHDLTNSKVLTFGDGLGFDSAYLAMHGCAVTYYEVSDECVQFAQMVFADNQLSITHVTSFDKLKSESFDIIVCLDVLEHVPHPSEIVERFACWLKPQGILFAHAPFFYLSPYHPTHLRSNAQYCGNDALYRQHGLNPIDGRYFWNPIVLKKGRTTRMTLGLALVKLGKPLLAIGRWLTTPFILAARKMTTSDACWIDDLKGMAKGPSSS